MQKRHIIYGAPGTGKTAHLMDILESCLKLGTPPDRIAYVSFTRAAVKEARNRAAAKFNLDPDDLVHFRTLHSTAFHSLGVMRDEVMSDRHWREFSDIIGERVSPTRITNQDGLPPSGGDASGKLQIIELSRARMIPIEEQWGDMSWLDNGTEHGLFGVTRIQRALNDYKQMMGLLDFTDMLEQYPKHCEPLDIDVAIIDEAQDLSRLQWTMANHAFQKASQVYIAGDDDQCIYAWSGADVATLIAANNSESQVHILKQSHRLPRAVKQVADTISSYMIDRVPKTWAPRDDDGILERHSRLSVVPLAEMTAARETVFMLARTGYLAREFVHMAREAGLLYSTVNSPSSVDPQHIAAIKGWEQLRKGNDLPVTMPSPSAPSVQAVYAQLQFGTGKGKQGAKKLRKLEADMRLNAEQLRQDYELRADINAIWHDALDGISLNDREYYLDVLRHGNEKLQDTPMVYCGTIHSVKGREADHVVLRRDLPRTPADGMRTRPDAEHRVWYVGVTRARKALHLPAPDLISSYFI